MKGMKCRGEYWVSAERTKKERNRKEGYDEGCREFVKWRSYNILTILSTIRCVFMCLCAFIVACEV